MAQIPHDVLNMKLKDTVVLAYNDIAAAGSRALLGLTVEADHATFTVESLTQTACSVTRNGDCNAKPACAAAANRTSPESDNLPDPIEVFNCMHEEISLVVVNAVLPGHKCHSVINALFDQFSLCRVKKLVVVTVLHLSESRLQHQSVYEHCLNSMPVTKSASLPLTTQVVDSFFNVFLQMALIDRIPTNCFIVPGYRTPSGLMDERTQQAVDTIQETLKSWTNLKFNKKVSHSILYLGDHDQDGDLSSMIYL
jgi:hypothetical protein